MSEQVVLVRVRPCQQDAQDRGIHVVCTQLLAHELALLGVPPQLGERADIASGGADLFACVIDVLRD
ncbi:MAG: hypothetical protein WKF72_09710 [Nocardioidaceae bacterium]